MTGDHLFDNVRPWLARPVDERIAFIRSARWIGTPQARAAHAMLEELLVRPPSLRTNGLMLLGPYANGKSMIAERFALTYLKATRAKGEAQKVWVVQTREGPAC
jgi:Bacterial TniB protein